MIRKAIRVLTCLCALGVPVLTSGTARAEEPVTAELRPGWRLPGGDHMAALHLRLAPGWKTYWRAPGEAGIPPVFDWSGSSNVARVTALWPTPHIFRQSGARSVGYKDELVLPLRIAGSGGPVTLKANMMIGVCSDICVPQTLHVTAVLPDSTSVDPMIAAALAEAPFTAKEARVSAVRCSVSPTKGGIKLRAEIDMPAITGSEETVVEAGQPELWASEPKTRRTGGTLVSETKLMHMEGKPFALDRSKLRFTVLGDSQAVDIQGCG
ncbi:protein-disulfide reductase DsbD domain-containing protein [Alloyangia pacifica]|uniref:protein-disulfide reductase DsbD domain-containing protein n=1 Tax=Alloyangia pacifica TaxID=311180 RepID=UPI001CFCD5D2|nr:protein-disulfide reductase DsbD domain-containing protein [Alloyangia pacifica]